MAAQVSGASLAEIYERLNSATAYHPMEAETFSDWSMEAGDTVTVTRGEESYQSPIHTTRMVWKGAPQVSISSSGKKERDAVARVGQRKYARGGAGMRNQQGFRYDFYSEDGYLHSAIEATASAIRTEVENTASDLRSSIQQTAESVEIAVTAARSDLGSLIKSTATNIYSTVWNATTSTFSTIEQTSEMVRTEVGTAVSGIAHSVIEQTATYIHMEVENAASSITKSVIEQTSEYVETTVASVASGVAWSVVRQTMTGIIQEVGKKATVYRQWSDPNDGVRVIRDGDIWVKVRDEKTWNDVANTTWEAMGDRKWKELYSSTTYTWNEGKGRWILVVDTAPIVESEVNIEHDNEHYSILAHQMDINGQAYDSNLTVTAQKISTEVSAANSNLYSTIAQTATNIVARVEDVRAGAQSTIEQTARSIRADVSAANSSLYSTIQITATNIYSRVTDETAGKYSTIEQTAESVAIAVTDAKSSMGSLILTTSTNIYSAVWDRTKSTYSTIEQTADKIRTMVVDENIGNYSTILQTSTSIALSVAGAESRLQSSIKVQSDRISLVVESSDPNSKITPASIVAAINGQGQSEIKLSANRINLDGYVTSTMLTGEYISTRLASAANLSVKKLSIQSGGTLQWSGNNTIITDANAASIIRNLKIESSGNTYTLSKITCGNGTWETVGSFSRAVSSWSVGGGSGKINVTANPQGQTKSVNISISGGDSITSNGSYTYKAMYEDDSQDDQEIGGNATKEITVSVPLKVTGNWNNNVFTAKYDASGSSSSVSETIGSRFYASSGSYYISATRLVGSNVTDITNTSKTYKLGLSGTTVQIQNTSGSQYSNTPTYSIPLETKSITSNGSYTPSSGKVGFSSVSVSVPSDITYFRTYAAAAGTSISAVSWTNNASGYHIISEGSNGSAGIIVGGEIKVNGGSSNHQYNYLQEAPTALYRYAYSNGYSAGYTDGGNYGRSQVTLNDPTWNAISGSTPDHRTITVKTSGRRNASGQVAELEKSATLYLTKGSWSTSGSSSTLYVSMRTGSTSGTTYASTSVSSSVSDLGAYKPNATSVTTSEYIRSSTTYETWCKLNGTWVQGSSITVTPNFTDKGGSWYCTITTSSTGVKTCRLTQDFSATQSVPFSNDTRYHLYI